MKFHHIFLSIVLTFSCAEKKQQSTHSLTTSNETPAITKTSLVLLGTIQDAGFPQLGCVKNCCKKVFDIEEGTRKVISLGLIDVPNNNTYLFEATPDIARQMKKLTRYEQNSEKEIVDGIFLTHAHIGHYTGLMYLGKEAFNAASTPVYTMPKMKEYLTNNGPWSQLVSQNNIQLMPLEDEIPVTLSSEINVTPFLVPHRDEFSETVGYKIQGPTKTALFIPDIDKWEKWDKNILDEIKKVDYAFLDATFYSGTEINNRAISQIPHPFIIESLEAFKTLEAKDKNKVIFIHFNHTNPVINATSDEAKKIRKLGFRIGSPNDVFTL